MKIECIHGYFKFTETDPGQLSQFESRFGFDLERSGDHFTFADLVDPPLYSIAGDTYLGSPALVTFAGEPWDVMRENGLVYNFALGLVVPIATVLVAPKIQQAGYAFVSNGMLLPGSIMEDGSRVTDYSAFYISTLAQFKYSEIGLEDL